MLQYSWSYILYSYLEDSLFKNTSICAYILVYDKLELAGVVLWDEHKAKKKKNCKTLSKCCISFIWVKARSTGSGAVLQAQVMAGLSTVMDVFQLSQPAMDKDGTNAPSKIAGGSWCVQSFSRPLLGQDIGAGTLTLVLHGLSSTLLGQHFKG